MSMKIKKISKLPLALLLLTTAVSSRAENLSSQSRTFKFSSSAQAATGIATNPMFHGVRPDFGLPASPSGIWTAPGLPTQPPPGQPMKKIGFQPPQPGELSRVESIHESFHSVNPSKDPLGAHEAGKIGFDLGDAQRPAAVDMRFSDLSGKQPDPGKGKSQGFSFRQFFWPKKGAPQRIPEPPKVSEIPKPDPSFRAKHKSIEDVQSDLKELLTLSLGDLRPDTSLKDILKQIDTVEVHSVPASHPHAQILHQFMSDLRVSVHSHLPGGIRDPEETRGLAKKITRQIEKAGDRESLEKSGLSLTLMDRLIEFLRSIAG